MSNRRFIILFLLGIVACAAGLWGLSERARVVASDATRRVLCPVDPSAVDAVTVTARDGAKMTLDADDGRFDEILREAVRAGKKIEPDFSVEF